VFGKITGDGDALAIGGNHFIHEIRRNIDLNVILFNNEIYGLTKGQFSPTSKYGQITKTSPFGTIETPFNPGELTIGAQGKFFARGIDNNVKLNIEIFKEADAHRGTSIIEILQNCVIYNDGANDYINNKEFRPDRQIIVKHGQPLIFGTNNDKGLVLEGLKLKVATIGQNGIKESDILIHDAHEPDPTLHLALINMKSPDFPVTMGVIRSVNAPTYDERTETQITEIRSKSSIKCMDDLLNSGNTWVVE
jgi:2-oxoglutarate ferredoxin oxidoreductase subunit beta